MEEKQLVKKDEILDMPIEARERIEPDIQIRKKKKISLYGLITISAFIFIAVFVFLDLWGSVINIGAKKIPAIIYSKIIGDDETKLDITLSEYLSGSLLGISKNRATKFSSTIAEAETDEHDIPPETTDIGKENIGAETENTLESTTIVSETDHAPSDSQISDEENGTNYPIVAMDLSQSSFGEYYIGNETAYEPDIMALLQRDDVVPAFSDMTNKNEPLVLIIHTHGTESYSEEGSDYYIDDGGELWRTDDTERNVIAIGKHMAAILNDEGINTLHCDIMHDKESYQDSYTRAAETIREYLAKYPSIKYVFDVHRDAILKADGTLVKAATEINGESVAQVMTVVGSNYKGANFPDWEKHLSLALRLRAKLNGKYENISRPVYLRGAAYNQQYTDGSLLLEIGTSGNTFAEAKKAAELVAYALSDIIKGK